MTHDQLKFISQRALDEFALAAERSPRRRRHRNLHETNDTIQRILRAMQPDTYMQPHRHLGEAPFRLFSLLKGSVGVVLFDEFGQTKNAGLLNSSKGNVLIEVPGDQYFTLVCLEKDSVLLEVREGPIQKDTRDKLSGFPDELEYLTQGPSSDLGKRVATLVAKWKNDVTYYEEQVARPSH